MEPMTPREAQLDGLFLAWLGDGASRSIAMTASKNGVPPGELVAHAQKFEWQKRLVVILNSARARAEDEAIEAIADINRRQLRGLRKLGAKAIEFLEAHPLDKASDAIKALQLSVELERQILGIGEKTEDVATVLAKRLEEARETKAKRKKVTVEPEQTAPAKALPPPKPEPEFKFQEDFTIEPAPEDELDDEGDTDDHAE